MKTQPIIPFDSPEAAQEVTVTGWRSRDGFFYGNGKQAEETARYAGCTHRPCRECGTLTEKLYLSCRGCRDLAEEARWLALPRAPWDGEQMLYSESRDRYYSSPDDVEDELEEGETVEDLRIRLCKPNRVRQVDPGDFSDDLPEDHDESDLPAELLEAIEAFNAVARACKPLSWSPGNVAWNGEVTP